MDPTRFGIGTWQTFNSKSDENVLSDLLRSATSKGIRFFDTADSYEDGYAEEVLGRLLSEYPRDSFQLCTKCFFPTRTSRRGGLGDRHVRDSLEGSLERLRVDSVDFYLAHRHDPDETVERVAHTFSALVEEGKTAHWGICRWPIAEAIKLINYCVMNGLKPPILQQYHYNLFTREAEERSFPLFYSHGLPTTSYSPLAQGVLTGKYGDETIDSERSSTVRSRASMWDLSPDKILKAQRWYNELESKGLTLTGAAIDFCLRRIEIDRVLLGVRSADQLEETLSNIAAALNMSEKWDVDEL